MKKTAITKITKYLILISASTVDAGPELANLPNSAYTYYPGNAGIEYDIDKNGTSNYMLRYGVVKNFEIRTTSNNDSTSYLIPAIIDAKYTLLNVSDFGAAVEFGINYSTGDYQTSLNLDHYYGNWQYEHDIIYGTGKMNYQYSLAYLISEFSLFVHGDVRNTQAGPGIQFKFYDGQYVFTNVLYNYSLNVYTPTIGISLKYQ